MSFALLTLLASTAMATKLYFNVTADEAGVIFDNDLGGKIATVVTFVGFADAGYDDQAELLRLLNLTLSQHDPVRLYVFDVLSLFSPSLLCLFVC